MGISASHFWREITTETLFGAYEHSAVPFERVARMFDGAVPGTHGGRFQVLLSMLPAEPDGNTAVSVRHLTPPQPKADLYLVMEESADGVYARFTYDTNLFDAATIRRFADHWAALHASVAAEPATPLGRLAMSSSAELVGSEERAGRVETTALSATR